MDVWLSPRDAYEGGELVVRTEAGERAFKGDAGDALVYPSGRLHRVAPVTRGERVVAVSWIQSLVRDDAARELLFSLAEVETSLAARGGADADVARLRQVRYALVRRWAGA
ncbi:MAG TPA: 2OG-Fe(II) oxygenase [Minicystis sp.]|nr:2OG-Fe(II) oxygenase [Minicystis sp.]